MNDSDDKAAQQLSDGQEPQPEGVSEPDTGQAPAAAPSRISFRIPDESNRLLAILDAGPAEIPPTLEMLQKALQLGGFQDVKLDSGALETLLDKAGKGETGEIGIGRRQPYIRLAFEFDHNDRTLYAVLAHGESRQTITPEAIELWMKKKGYDSYWRNDNALALLFRRIEQGREGRIAFARKLDARILVELSTDHMQAHVTTRPAYGGEPLNQDKVRNALEKAGLAARFREDEVINRLVSEVPVDKLLIAEGVAPVHGSNARMIFLVEETVNVKPREDAHGNVNLHQMHQFLIVEPGTALMRREAATRGSDGYDVYGTTLDAIPGRDLNFSPTLIGAEIDPDDPNLLIATIKGHPLLGRTSVQVDPVLHLSEVDVRTGNIDFDGAVSVAGDVHAGMQITATSDVHIEGFVEKAKIIAGNDIVVNGGVIGGDGSGRRPGEDSADNEENAPNSYKTLLKAGGSIRTKYINQAEVECTGDLVIAEYLMHSRVTAKGQLLLGQQGGKGCLIGGHCHAAQGGVANILGNENYLKTNLSLGYPREIAEQLKRLPRQRDRQNAILDKLQEGREKLQKALDLNLARAAFEEKIAKVDNAIRLATTDRDRLEQQYQSLQSYADEHQAVVLMVRERSFPNTRLCINGEELRVDNESGPGNFRMENEQVYFSGKRYTAGPGITQD